MTYKWLGAVMVITGCGGVGISIAAAYRKEEQYLIQLIRVLQNMENELQFQLTPLPELCRRAEEECSGPLRAVFSVLAREMDSKTVSDVYTCMLAGINSSGELSVRIRRHLRQLGKSLGRYDLPGQIKGLQAVQAVCEKDLHSLDRNKDVRLRSYQTLGMCAGAALVILFA